MCHLSQTKWGLPWLGRMQPHRDWERWMGRGLMCMILCIYYFLKKKYIYICMWSSLLSLFAYIYIYMPHIMLIVHNTPKWDQKWQRGSTQSSSIDSIEWFFVALLNYPHTFSPPLLRQETAGAAGSSCSPGWNSPSKTSRFIATNAISNQKMTYKQWLVTGFLEPCASLWALALVLWKVPKTQVRVPEISSQIISKIQDVIQDETSWIQNFTINILSLWLAWNFPDILVIFSGTEKSP